MVAVAPLESAASRPAVEASLDDRICQFLVARGRLKETDLVRGRRLHEEDPASGSLVSLLTRLGLVSEREMAEAVSELLSLPLLSAKEFPETPPQNVQTSVRFLKHHHLCPIGETDEEVTVLVADPADAFPLQALRLATGREIKLNIGLRSEIDDLIERYYGSGRSAMGTIVENLTDENNRSEDDIEHLRDLASEAPVIRLVNLIIQRAVEQRTSDIHVEPFENRLKVRYRIDGVLHEVESPPAASTAAVISRIKIMAKLNIAERRLPQDGRIMIRVQGKELDLRVSTVPTAHGESVVMRILDREAVVFDFKTLGFTDQFLQKFLNVLELPHGIMLVTGPTGSGKTTTLYTALSKLNTDDVKIITVEDPVEYQIEGINQIQAKAAIGLDFSHALRSIVRQDPDIIMIGEMRDLETAKIAIQSALTGHLVLSTLHTNNAAGGITRMLDMGVEDYLLTSTVNGILAQRLVRRLDLPNAQRVEAMPEVIKEYELEKFTDERPIKIYKPGSSVANPTGYFGRTTIMEFLVMSDAIRRQIMQHAGMGDIEQQARAEGMRTMFEDGLVKSLQGSTTIEEVLRVTSSEN
ncbi:type II secretion system ATPase GspE [Dokdonella ginsengisoli]|uniref:Type II secretion system protein E n=1 Tax=Dokdonella ginsengisoli TaxID=363846 RepID=A0ABV9QRK1_9GAMM